ncbi:hypothetical protein GCWU000324_01924 [Kingella oralis ATCC 51147]|uniref:Uncharacterized protein n=1 Tax=Kingella oralis ATCC 51147 TaxID=629741 RepID=C4GIQ3_9NEIS|nr:hypothetical protein GCWU000324_01924 [Kingella oralis ATCC 51147]
MWQPEKIKSLGVEPNGFFTGWIGFQAALPRNTVSNPSQLFDTTAFPPTSSRTQHSFLWRSKEK